MVLAFRNYILPKSTSYLDFVVAGGPASLAVRFSAVKSFAFAPGGIRLHPTSNSRSASIAALQAQNGVVVLEFRHPCSINESWCFHENLDTSWVRRYFPSL